MRLALLLACLASPAGAIGLGCPQGWVQEGLMDDALAFQGYALTAWGLNDAGHMEELWTLDTGEWLVTATTAEHCSTVVSRPAEFMGRLSTPSNDADTFGQGVMGTGEPL